MDGAAVVALRFALFADLLVLVGLAGFTAVHAPRRARVLAVLAVAGLSLSAAGLIALAAAMAGTAITQIDRATIVMLVTGTAVGAAWIVRTATLIAATAFARQPLMVALFAAVALATLAWSGHGAMDDGARGWLHCAVDIVHLLAAAGWIGVLVALLLLLARPPASEQVARTAAILHGFATTGSLLVAALVASGIVNVALLLGWPSFATLAGTLYGRLLLAKLALFAAMLTLASLNRFRLTPALAQEPARAWRALRRSIAAETACGVMIVALVAWLGTLAPPTP